MIINTFGAFAVNRYSYTRNNPVNLRQLLG
jgi:hypothetical protein